MEELAAQQAGKGVGLDGPAPPLGWNDLGAQMLPLSLPSLGEVTLREPHLPVRQQLGHEDGQSLLASFYPHLRTGLRGMPSHRLSQRSKRSGFRILE